jgi:hypothetical protein
MNDRERDPYKFVMLAGIGLLSLVTLVRFNHSATGILLAFPRPWAHVLLGGIVVNSAIALYGIIRQHTVRGVLWERVGQTGLAGQFLIYGVWGFSLFSEKATGFAGLLVTLALAAILRVVQIERRRRKAVKRGSP